MTSLLQLTIRPTLALAAFTGVAAGAAVIALISAATGDAPRPQPVVAVAAPSPDVAAQTVTDGLLATPAAAVDQGYTLATNTVHPSCFEPRAIGSSTSTMDYSFAELDAATVETLDAEAQAFVRAAIDQARAPGRETRHVLAVLTVHQITPPVEAGVPTAATLALVRHHDLADLQASCGTYFIRSITKRSRHLAVFSYTAKPGAAADEQFERDLMLSVTTFGVDPPSAGEQQREARLRKALARRTLRVAIAATAPGAAPSTITDPSDYLRSLQAAFRAAQQPDAGKLVALEVVPWAEVPAIRAALEP